MLSSRDTPMNEDGWALLIEDVRRLALLIGGGANDLNAGAVDADQQALNDLSSALNAHEVAADAHSALFAAVTAAIAAATASTATAATASVNTISGGAQTIAAGVTADLTTWTATGTATLSGMNTTTGIFTAPATGLYFVSGWALASYPLGGSTEWWALAALINGTFAPQIGEHVPLFFNRGSDAPSGAIAGATFLTSGDTVKLQIASVGTATLTVTYAHFNIVRLA